jgi:hypothetical protein
MTKNWKEGRKGSYIMSLDAQCPDGADTFHVFAFEHDGQQVVDFGYPYQFYYEQLAGVVPFTDPLVLSEDPSITVAPRDVNILMDKLERHIKGASLLADLMAGKHRKAHPLDPQVDAFKKWIRGMFALEQNEILTILAYHVIEPFSDETAASDIHCECVASQPAWRTPWYYEVTSGEVCAAAGHFLHGDELNEDFKKLYVAWMDFCSKRHPSHDTDTLRAMVANWLVCRFGSTGNARAWADYGSQMVPPRKTLWGTLATPDIVREACTLLEEWEGYYTMFEARNTSIEPGDGPPPKDPDEVKAFEEKLRKDMEDKEDDNG